MTPFVHVALHNPKDMTSDQQEKDVISALRSNSNHLCLGDETDQKFIYPCPSLPCPIAFCALTWVTEMMCSRIAFLFCRFRCFTQTTSSSLKGEEDEESGWDFTPTRLHFTALVVLRFKVNYFWAFKGKCNK